MNTIDNRLLSRIGQDSLARANTSLRVSDQVTTLDGLRSGIFASESLIIDGLQNRSNNKLSKTLLDFLKH